MRQMLFQNKCLLLIAHFFAILLFLISCKSKGENAPTGFQLDKPKRSELGKALNEISGLFYSVDDSSLLAIADSKEKVFQIDLRTRKLKDYTDKVVNPGSDVEDVVKLDTSLYLLMSKGILVEVPKNATDTASVKTYELGLGGTNDFETLYYDPSANGLVLLCKTCAHEKGTGVRTAFRF